MNKREIILNELQSISPEVARLDGTLPYAVPAGYFDGLADRMLGLVKALEAPLPVVLQEAKGNAFKVPAGYFESLPELLLQRAREQDDVMSPVLKDASANPYKVPAGYFESFPDRLLLRAKAQEETVSAVLQGANKPAYTVPTGYFESFPILLLMRVKGGEAEYSANDLGEGLDLSGNAGEELAALSPLLNGIGRKMPFATPEGYFSDLTDNAVSGVQAIDFVNGELENLSPLMASLKDKAVYEAPAGYFETLPRLVLNKAKAGQDEASYADPVPAKVVSISFASRVMRYAVAAAVVGIVAVGAWWYVGKSGTAVKPSDIAQVKDPVVPVDLNKLSEAELQSYLDEQTTPLSSEVLAMNAKADDIKAGDMSNMLVDVSDEEIQKYLEQNTFITKNTSTN